MIETVTVKIDICTISVVEILVHKLYLVHNAFLLLLRYFFCRLDQIVLKYGRFECSYFLVEVT